MRNAARDESKPKEDRERTRKTEKDERSEGGLVKERYIKTDKNERDRFFRCAQVPSALPLLRLARKIGFTPFAIAANVFS